MEVVIPQSSASEGFQRCRRRTPAATTSEIARGSRLNGMNYNLDQDELEAIESSEGAEIMRNGVHILTATILVVAILMSVRMDLSLAVLNLVLLSLFAGLYVVGSYYLERMTGVWQLAWLTIGRAS